MGAKRRLIIVSNRLPIQIQLNENGHEVVEASSGGLVSALEPALRQRGGIWIGWSGGQELNTGENLFREMDHKKVGYELEPVHLSAEEVLGYYEGFSNEILWPLFHDLVSRARFDPSYKESYECANRKFAQVCVRVTEADDFVWVHDYHLIFVARELRALQVQRQIGFFLHIPFPSPDIFQKLPWAQELLEAFMEYDLVGLQTPHDCANFFDNVRQLFPDYPIHDDRWIEVESGRRVQVRAFPIGIDAEDFEARARDPEVTKLLTKIQGRSPQQRRMLGIDRLDYSKGIPQRIQAFERALERFPELCEEISFYQVVIPSRTNIDEYKALKDEIDRLIGAVNGRFATTSWTPIHYMYRSLTPVELIAFYRMGEVICITPLKDGMNLIAKEYCACNLDEDGVLILSEFAGASDQLGQWSLTVNPFDIDAVADAIQQAFSLPKMERKQRMSQLRDKIKQTNVYRWVDDFLRAADD